MNMLIASAAPRRTGVSPRTRGGRELEPGIAKTGESA
jgi:hypothetical protein